MKSLIIAAALLGAAVPGLAQTNLSLEIGQPGFYGRLDIGDFGRPPVVYAQPIIIERHVRAAPQPLYLRVPPGHMKKWGKHCGRYNACGRQVYFVRDDWYNNTYAPRYREMHGGGGRGYRGDDRPRTQVIYTDSDRGRDYDHGGKGKGKDKDHGHGHGKGHGNGKH